MKTHERTLTRRAALRLLSAAGVLPLSAVAGSFGALVGCQPRTAHRRQAFARVLADPVAMVRVGRVWLAAQPATATVETLLDALGWPDGVDAAEPTTLRTWLAARQRSDWLEGRVVGVDSYRLTATEAHLYALAALLFTEDPSALDR